MAASRFCIATASPAADSKAEEIRSRRDARNLETVVTSELPNQILRRLHGSTEAVAEPWQVVQGTAANGHA